MNHPRHKLSKILRHLFEKICARLDPVIFYQVRNGSQTKWITPDEWFKEYKLNPYKRPYEIRQVAKGITHELN